MRTSLTVVLVLGSLTLSAQYTPPWQMDVSEKAYCTPGILNKSRSRGVDIAYNFFGGGIIRTRENDITDRPGELEGLESIILKVKVPLINKPGLKMLLGYSYMPERYIFESLPVVKSSLLSSFTPNFSDVVTDIDTRRLKHNAFNIYIMKPLNERHYLAIRGSAAFNGDYKGWVKFDQRYAAYSATVAFGIKRNRDLEYGFGIGFNHNFRRTLALPFFLYNRNFNEKWGVEAVLPAFVNGRYNIDPKTIFLFGYQFNSSNYSIDIRNRYTDENQIYHLGHSEILAGVSLERQIMPWVWANVKTGYQFNLPTRFDATVPGWQSYSAIPSNQMYLRVGMFISPPDKYIR